MKITALDKKMCICGKEKSVRATVCKVCTQDFYNHLWYRQRYQPSLNKAELPNELIERIFENNVDFKLVGMCAICEKISSLVDIIPYCRDGYRGALLQAVQ